MRIQYDKGCFVQSMTVKGVRIQSNVLSTRGAFTGIRTDKDTFSSIYATHTPRLQITDSSITIADITLTSKEGRTAIATTEDWTFTAGLHKIRWKIDRRYGKSLFVEDMSYPEWTFKDLSLWEGGIISNGGIVWCKYLKNKKDTYGVHTGGTTFWNKQSGIGLSIQAVKGKISAVHGAPLNSLAASNAIQVATKYTHTPLDEFSMASYVSSQPLQQRYRLDRFVSGKSDVFAPFKVEKAEVSQVYELQSINYFDQYNRGHLVGIDADAVRDLLNTTARYGVVDDSIVGANGWLTNWKCLHEPFFAQLALAIDDSAYTKNLQASLDREMQLAIQPDGRVLSRWHNEPGDEMPGTYNTKTGYYEAKWGYTIDAQTGYVINVADLFNLTGKLTWLKDHQKTCEQALEWLTRRDSNHNGIFEMKNNSIADQTCSDWLDIVWASYENAFVNAQMYGALVKWADCERLLGNLQAAKRYTRIAQRLKTAFNKPVKEGGFWMPEKNQFIYWRDKDGTIHGDNLVTPVQFAAIGYGVCDDPAKIAKILTQIQRRMANEKLFHWPLCFDSYRKPEVSAGNWPFPKYENGDIFLTWGYLGIKSYAHYNKDLAVYYIHKLLNQYKKDGLSFQRYDRIHQQGMGSDILAGNATTIAALYSDIYGIQPRWNRLIIQPHLPKSLQGTQFNYTLRGIQYNVSLQDNYYQVRTNKHVTRANQSFGISQMEHVLRFYPGDQDSCSAVIACKSSDSIFLKMNKWDNNTISFNLKISKNCHLSFEGLQQAGQYAILINGHKAGTHKARNGLLHIQDLPAEKCLLTLKHTF
ncbi:hypothetical protein GCM10027566_00610 [Arachidicoccus ginsenosidivorans]